MAASAPASNPETTPLGDGRSALAVERPESIEELREAVARRAGEGRAIYPQGGRTALDYGEPPEKPGVAIDLSGLSGIVDYPAADMTITVEAGMTIAALATVLGAERQRLEVDAPEPDRATLGGVFATATTGPRRFGWGRPRDQIIGVEFVTGDGMLVKGGGRVVKNVAGYDFPKILTGSLGSLGIIARLTIKVRPKPEASALAWLGCRSSADLIACLDRLNLSSTRPTAIEVLNRSAPGSLPGFPWTLAIGFEDNAASVAWQLDRLPVELASLAGLERVDGGVEAIPSWDSLRDFPARIDASGPVSIVANLTPSAAARWLATLEAEAEPSANTPGWSIQAHGGTGVVRAHAIGSDPEIILASIERHRATVEADGGSLLVPRCPTDWKPRAKVWGNPRPDWGWNARIKAALDPSGLMNPGRFVGKI